MYLEAEKHIINIIIVAPQNLFRILSQKRVYYMLKIISRTLFFKKNINTVYLKKSCDVSLYLRLDLAVKINVSDQNSKSQKLLVSSFFLPGLASVLTKCVL